MILLAKRLMISEKQLLGVVTRRDTYDGLT
jgi:hypothetical protein